VAWLGLLFSICHHAELASGEENPLQGHTAEYRQRTIQCLIAANYTDPRVYTIEVLILHTFKRVNELSRWWYTAISSSWNNIPLARRMGIDRDSRAHNGLTPFQGEMRRRVWAIIRQMDIVSSFELSLPATIQYDDSRCALPRNIFNGEFNKNTKELPPPRALSEETEIAYNIIKTRLTLELGKILAVAESEDDPIRIFPRVVSCHWRFAKNDRGPDISGHVI
jgi:hypothetical protein